MNKKILERYFDGRLNLKEDIKLSEQIADTQNQYIEQNLKLNWDVHMDSSSDDKSRSFKPLLDRIHHQIHKNQSIYYYKARLKLHRWIAISAAAVLVPIIVISGIYFFDFKKEKPLKASLIEIIAPEGSRIKFNLPDGTEGFLNSKSRLSYSASFFDNRVVNLQGEAFFDVAHDQSHEFKVFAGNSIIKVLGTRFNVAAYVQDVYTEVVLEEGSINYISSDTGKELKMSPGQRLVEKEGKIQRSEVEAWKYSSWKDGKLVFRNDPMDEVARRISRWYNVEVVVPEKFLSDDTFRGVFEDDSLEEVLRLIELTSQIKFQIIDRVSQQDSSFSRKKVILSRK